MKSIAMGAFLGKGEACTPDARHNAKIPSEPDSDPRGRSFVLLDSHAGN